MNIKDTYHIEIEMEQELSPDCKKTSTEYYELLVQLRFTFFEELEDIKKRTSKLIYSNFKTINKIDEGENYVDIYFRNRNELNKLSKLFNSKYFCEEKRSKKIVGRNFLESKDIWRHTLLLNIIDLHTKDIISVKGKEYTIKAFNNKDLVLIESGTGSKKVINYNMIKDYIKLVQKFKK